MNISCETVFQAADTTDSGTEYNKDNVAKYDKSGNAAKYDKDGVGKYDKEDNAEDAGPTEDYFKKVGVQRGLLNASRLYCATSG